MKFWRPRSLFWSLTGSIVGILILTAVLQAVFVLAVFEPIARARQRAQAEDFVAEIAPEVAAAVSEGRARAVPSTLGRYQRLADGIFLAFEGTDGKRVLPGSFGRRGRHGGPSELRERPRPRHGPPLDPARAREIARAPVQVGGATVGSVVAFRPDIGLSLTRWIPVRALLTIPAALVAALLGGIWIFRRLQLRLERLEGQARAVAAGDLDARISDPGDDELGQVGRQLNDMTASLAHARAELRASDEQRRRLLADITHEISTPLTSIRGYAETLLDENVSVDDRERERFVREVLHAAQRIDTLVSDLLDLARLEAGSVDLVREEIDLKMLVHHTVERQRVPFERAGLRLVEKAGERPVAVRGDGLRLEQVVDNLLLNALRHVPSGCTVAIGVSREDQHAILEVEDDGPGFPPEALAHVFERFYRAESSRSTPGSGLGLAIVREIMLRHGGDIAADNCPSGGARIRARLPLAD